MKLKELKNKLDQAYLDLRPEIRKGNQEALKQGKEIGEKIERLAKLEGAGIVDTDDLIDLIPTLIDDLSVKVARDKARSDMAEGKKHPAPDVAKSAKKSKQAPGK